MLYIIGAVLLLIWFMIQRNEKQLLTQIAERIAGSRYGQVMTVHLWKVVVVLGFVIVAWALMMISVYGFWRNYGL
jgi:hypothetical protein